MKTIYAALKARQEKGDVVSIPGKRGDLLIWHSHLAHGNCRNEADAPRLAQYITMFPSPSAAAEAGGRYAKLGADGAFLCTNEDSSIENEDSCLDKMMTFGRPGGDTNAIAATAEKEMQGRIDQWMVRPETTSFFQGANIIIVPSEKQEYISLSQCKCNRKMTREGA